MAEVGQVQPADAGERERVTRLLEGELVGGLGRVVGPLDPRDRLGGNVDARDLAIHEGERTRPAHEDDCRQDRSAFRQPLLVQCADERLEPVRVITDLELEEPCSGRDLLRRTAGAVIEWWRARVLDGSDEERGSWIDLASREVAAGGERGRDPDQLGPVEVEDAARLRLVARRDVVARQAADVVHVVQRRPHDVCLARDAILVPAHDLQDRLDAGLCDRDGTGDVGGVGVRSGVVSCVHRVDPPRHLGDPLPERRERSRID